MLDGDPPRRGRLLARRAAKLFQPLVTTKAKGTGLGLAILASIVQRHHGTVRVETEVGRGTTFVIELPAEPAPVLEPVGSGA